MKKPNDCGKSEEEIRKEMTGFPAETVDALLALQAQPDAAHLDAAVRRVLEFYLPRHNRRSLRDVPGNARLREDVGVDSLALAEAAFKLDEVLGIAIDSRETAKLVTLDDLLGFLQAKLQARA